MGIDYDHSLSSPKDKIHFALQHLTRTLHILGLRGEHVRERKRTPQKRGKGHGHQYERHQHPDYSTEMSGYFILKFV